MDTHSLPPWYLTGLLEGRASFSCARNGRSVQPNLDVTLPPDETELLERLRGDLGGRLVRGGRALRVTRSEDLMRVVEHLESFPPQGAGRRRTVTAWSAVVRARGDRTRRAPRETLQALVDRLQASQPRRRGRHARPALDSEPHEE